MDEAGTTSGREVSECGAVGVIIKESTLGVIIGPPADNEYAVDPVGVAIIKPSELYSQTLCPSTLTEAFNILCEAPFQITMSFSADLAIFSLLSRISALKRILFSIS